MPNPVLYILMRTDLPSMNAGKAMAQASHASNAFLHDAKTNWKLFQEETEMVELWQKETAQGFGTVLTLAATLEQIQETMRNCGLNLVIHGLVLDPSYPYRVMGEIANVIYPQGGYDNTKEVTLVRPEITCAYVFGDKDGIAGGKVSGLKLHP